MMLPKVIKILISQYLMVSLEEVKHNFANTMMSIIHTNEFNELNMYFQAFPSIKRVDIIFNINYLKFWRFWDR